MNKGEIKFICILLVLIIVFASILIYKIKSEPEYDKELYAEIYSEYQNIFSNTSTNVESNEEIAENEVESKNKVKTIIKGMDLPEYTVIGEISIPKINITYPIIGETTDEYLKIAPTRLRGPNVNGIGNLCVVAHNYKNTKFFSKLSQLDINDTVYLTSISKQKLEYFVYDKYEVNENDMGCTSQSTNGNIEATLITCTTNQDKRLVVKCKAKI